MGAEEGESLLKVTVLNHPFFHVPLPLFVFLNQTFGSKNLTFTILPSFPSRKSPHTRHHTHSICGIPS